MAGVRGVLPPQWAEDLTGKPSVSLALIAHSGTTMHTVQPAHISIVVATFTICDSLLSTSGHNVHGCQGLCWLDALCTAHMVGPSTLPCLSSRTL